MNEGLRESLRAGTQLALAGALAALLLAGAWALTRDRIAEGETRALRDALALVLPASLHDNNPAADTLRVKAPAWLGQAEATVYRARRGRDPAALVLEATAPDGYAGPIRLLVGVDADGRVLGVRVTRHQETPGLGDDIEARRSDWIRRFDGRRLGDPPLAAWRVERDGGAFPQFAGATVTPRALVAALRRSLQFVQVHGEALWAAPAGATLSFDDAPADPPPP